jgi:hypothetical protein
MEAFQTDCAMPQRSSAGAPTAHDAGVASWIRIVDIDEFVPRAER